MFRKVLSLLLFIMFCHLAFARTDPPANFNTDRFNLPEVIPPSPSVASLMTFEEVPVDNYSGQPNITIPLYSKAISKDLSLSLGLRYTASGVMVNNISGWTGVGWALDAGGTISRTVRGVPDESTQNNKLGVLHNPEFWQHINGSLAIPNEFAWRAVGTSVYQYDTELDLYQYSFPGGSGRFVIVLENGVLTPKLITKDQLVRIEITSYDTATYQISGFRLTDPKGNLYTFGYEEIESSYSTAFTVSTPQSAGGSGGSISSSGADGAYSARSAWHLNEITNSSGLSLASFDYVTVNESYVVSRTETINEVINVGATAGDQEFMNSGYNQGILRPARSISYFQVSTTTKKISKVTFRDSTLVYFDLDTAIHPETGGGILDKIRVTHPDYPGYNKQFRLTYQTVSENGRLWLDKIEQTDNAGANPLSWELFYHQRDNLPGFGSPTDFWGYSNRNYSVITSLGIEEVPQAVTSGTLRKVTYPTGGSKEFIFEPATYGFAQDTELTEADFLLNPDNFTVDNFSLLFSGSYTPGQTATVLEQGTMAEVTHDQVAELASTLTSSCGDCLDNMVLEIIDQQSTVVQRAKVNKPLSTVSLPQGNNFTVRVVSLDDATFTIDGSVTLRKKDRLDTLVSEFLYGGGVRIKEVLFKDSDDSVRQHFTYNYRQTGNAKRSSGVVDGLYGRLNKQYEFNETKFFFDSDQCLAAINEKTIRYRTTVYGSANVGMSKGNYIGYSEVTASQPGNGRTVSSYTSAKDPGNSSPLSTLTYPFQPGPDLDYKRGLLVKQMVYNDSGDMLQMVENQYSSTEETIAQWLWVSDHGACSWKQFYNTYDEYLNKSYNEKVPDIPCQQTPAFNSLTLQNCDSFPGINTVRIPLTFGWAKLDSTTSTSFYSRDTIKQELTSQTRYTYSSLNYQPVTIEKIVNEGGQNVSYVSENYFVTDSVWIYNNTVFNNSELAAIEKLKALNRVTTPVFTETYRNGVLLNKLQMGYDEVATDQVELTTLYGALGNNSLESRLEYRAYDQYGNILEVAKTDGVPVSYVWGYYNTLPVAKVLNADHATVEAALPAGIELDNPISSDALLTDLEVLYNSSNLSAAQVMTYGYHPLQGMQVAADLNKRRTTYHYDLFDRLESVRDFENNTLQEFEYYYGHGTSENFVKTYVAREQGLTNLKNVNNKNKVQESIQYLDGLGRVMQTVVRRGTPGGKDIVTPIVYDQYGRQTREYLPFESNTTSGDFVADALTKQDAFYDDHFNGRIDPDSTYAFSEARLEASPLARPLEQAAPGEIWRMGGGHTVEMDYVLNDSTDGVKYLRAITDVNGNTVIAVADYAAHELMITTTTDENTGANQGETWQFTDALGRVVMKQVKEKAGQWAKTYYVYDDYHNLRFVIQPEGIRKIESTETNSPTWTDVDSEDFLKSWVFCYNYDHRDRLIEKRVPGADWVYMVYDHRDRLVATQDGNQRTQDVEEVNGNKDVDRYQGRSYKVNVNSGGRLALKQGFRYIYSGGKKFVATDDVVAEDKVWIYTKYDALDRPVATGFYHNNADRQTLQNQVDDPQYTFSESYTGTGALQGYTNMTFPDASPADQLTVTYYDEYGFGAGVTFPAGTEPVVKGQVTGSRTRVMKTGQWLETVTLYDSRYRPVMVTTDNHKNGQDVIENHYRNEISGLVSRTFNTHTSDDYTGSLVVTDSMTYDHMDRLLKNMQSVNGSTYVTIAENTYNDLGELVSKQLGDSAQIVDYEYSIRGWLTKINGGTALTGTDKFGMELQYEAAQQYNGNIGRMLWQSKGGNGVNEALQQYDYTYDPMSRLKTAVYSTGKAGIVAGAFNVGGNDNGGIAYDANGNIENLFRYQQKSNESQRYLIDNLTYITQQVTCLQEWMMVRQAFIKMRDLKMELTLLMNIPMTPMVTWSQMKTRISPGSATTT